MAERTQVTEVVQLGSETVLGTPVAADVRLPGLTLSAGLDGSFTEVVPSGFKFPTREVLGKEWSKGSLTGQPSYDELAYLLAGVLASPTPAQLEGTDAYLWTFTPSTSVEDTVASFTIEQGGPVRAHRSAGNVVTSIKLTGDSDGVEVSADLMGQLFEDGVSLSAGASMVPQVPIFAKEVSVYLDDAPEDLGNTKLGRLFKWELSFGNRFGPLWVVDSAQTSWVVPVEQVIDGSFTMTVEADAEGMALLANMRSGETGFISLQATSPVEAGAGNAYALTIDMAGQISEVPSDFSDEQGTVAVGWKWKLVHDAGWGKAISAELVNTLTAL